MQESMAVSHDVSSAYAWILRKTKMCSKGAKMSWSDCDSSSWHLVTKDHNNVSSTTWHNKLVCKKQIIVKCSEGLSHYYSTCCKECGCESHNEAGRKHDDSLSTAVTSLRLISLSQWRCKMLAVMRMEVAETSKHSKNKWSKIRQIYNCWDLLMSQYNHSYVWHAKCTF